MSAVDLRCDGGPVMMLICGVRICLSIEKANSDNDTQAAIVVNSTRGSWLERSEDAL